MKKNNSVILDKVIIKIFLATIIIHLISVIFLLFGKILKNIVLYYFGVVFLITPLFILLPFIVISFIDLISIIKQKEYIK